MILDHALAFLMYTVGIFLATPFAIFVTLLALTIVILAGGSILLAIAEFVRWLKNGN